jgi:hypothetical protein
MELTDILINTWWSCQFIWNVPVKPGCTPTRDISANFRPQSWPL